MVGGGGGGEGVVMVGEGGVELEVLGADEARVLEEWVTVEAGNLD
jgi:hypothetical protein